ncbi:hypothetical protein ACJRO7_031913 [Eucalyptus globulus]|uniref:Protein SIEVE ELEMENT OCCLUSION B-like n=1 Tax=Eucalyptus globulus TaxID=34317 RepID=A0ABD3JP00_EUCGL
MAGNKSFLTSLLSLLNDDNFMNDIMTNQSETEQVDVNDYLSLVEKILDPKGDQGQNKSSTSQSPVPLSSTVNELCCKITCDALHTNNARQTMESLFVKLSSFPWDAKAVLTLSAFSVYYAENEHLEQIEESNYKLGSAAMLRGRRAGKSDFVALKNLIRVTSEFTKCAVEFANYCQKFGRLPTSTNLRAGFYRVIFGVIGCSVPFSGMISASNEFLGQDLLTFSNRVTGIYESFKKEVEEEIKRVNEEQSSYKKIKELSRSGTGIVELMVKLFCTENDLTVYQCSKRKTVEVTELKNKNVMLLISNLSLSDDELGTLTGIYDASIFKSSNYEIMWVPLVEVHNEETRKQFQDKRSRMLWYSCKSMVSKIAAKFIRKKWKFSEQTQVVVLNRRGQVENFHVMSMIHIWGINAFPFTLGKRNELWRSQVTNWFKLVVNNSVFPNIEQSIEKGELIFLYGSAVGSKTIERIEGHLSKIRSDLFKFSNHKANREQFFTRLDSCMSLKMQESSDVYDSQTEELVKLYTSYKQDGGFAIVARGSSVVINTRLTDFEMVLSQHQHWFNSTNAKTFETVFKAYYDKVVDKSLCHHFYIPSMVGNIPDKIKCRDCNRYLKTVITFECCHSAH